MNHINQTFKISTLSLATLLALSACSNNDAIQHSSSEIVNTVSSSTEVASAQHSSDVEYASESAPMPVVIAAKESMNKTTKMVRAIPVMPVNNIDNEKYQKTAQNDVKKTTEDAIATFSIDTDTGSYANVRRFLQDGRIPPSDAIRYEELLNYFNYNFDSSVDSTQPTDAPFKVSMETVSAPWKTSNQIVKVAIKSIDDISENNTLPPANLVFLVDVSGSMSSPDKLNMAKASLKMLTKQLRKQDTISLITYAGNTEIVLPATSGKDTRKILRAIEKLDANGSTNGESAIKLAYQQAKDNFKDNGINRILMLTDGDFNVGVSGVDEMLNIIKKNRDDGVSLSTFGFGTGNYNEHMMEQVANNGNGNYSYIDSVSEAKKSMVDEMSSTFNTIAKDVKVQVEFNPASVSEWRLIGYENRILADEDFSNDKVDAGELGAGKSVVALFEVTPTGAEGYLPASRYQADKNQAHTAKNKKSELGYLKIRYKAPNGTTSQLIEYPISKQLTTASNELNFAIAVAGYGQLLKDSKYAGSWTYQDVINHGKKGLGSDPLGTRHEFLKLVDLADALQ